MSAPKTIYLRPMSGSETAFQAIWYVEAEIEQLDDLDAVRYVRADLAEAEVARLRELLAQKLALLDGWEQRFLEQYEERQRAKDWPVDAPDL